ncbi:patched domain-containing protein 3-like isoform X2 [Condylostylus longicornis]|uniref:patched domain-containing protein 3-like isoform X2 n=1 Tax=Condylostylus longicornis TaxID=2530218 RepID=UPI00244DE118|nr:patched domain-containing protein 3-like isoform X2 [Condylostylus longicornis]
MGNMRKISSKLSNTIADTFYRIGYAVSCNPWKSIIFTACIFGITCFGFFRFEIQRDPLELWVPKDSQFIKTTKWVLKNLNTASRIQTALLTAPNVLEPSVLKKLLVIHHEIEQVHGKLKNGTNIKWSDVCLKIPFISQINAKRRKREIDTESNENSFLDIFGLGSIIKNIQRDFEPSVDLPSIIYCRLLDNLPRGCFERNFVELFNYSENLDEKITLNDVTKLLKKNETQSPVTGHMTDFSELLGGIERNEKGEIIGAKAIIIQWFINLNLEDVEKQKMGNMAGTESWITEEAAVWEEAFLQKMKQLKLVLDDVDVKVYYNAEKSFGDISHEALFQDTNKIAIGIVLMTIYVQIVLSKFNWTEIRFGLSGLGLFSVGLAFFSACGICSFFNINYGPVHTSLPFLLMGLGVDDMFVLMACWRKIQYKDQAIEEKVGLMVKHAGASITVTSLTDIIAFVVGSTTVIPSLQSFCLYAAVGVFMTYLYVITFYVAIFTLDEYRIRAKRNSFVPFFVHKSENLKYFCDLNLMNKCLNIIYGKIILTKFGKIMVFLTAIALTAISGQSLLKIEQKFDPAWFIPESTYLNDYIKYSRQYFPESGYAGSVFMGNLNYSAILPKIYNLTIEIEKNNMFHKTKSWIKPFQEFVEKNYNMDISKDILTDYDFKFYLSKFLFSAKGGKFQANFNFDTILKCGEPTPNVKISWIDFHFKKFYHRDDYLPAMKTIDQMVKEKHFEESGGDGFAESWSRAYGNWITDEVNVGGFMQIWGLTIDLVSCIGLQLAVGLCVDYAAHVGHTFLVKSDENRNKRTLNTILHIGGAVIYGGGSTLLALLLLSQSEAYTFKSFFKIFFLIIIFGLFHGVVFLPIVLSLIGPAPYQNTDQGKNAKKQENIDEVEVIRSKDILSLKETPEESTENTKFNVN